MPTNLRSIFEETIQPELIAALRECLLQTSPANPHVHHEAVMTKLSEHHQLIYSRLEGIKQQLENPQIIQQQIQNGFLGGFHEEQPAQQEVFSASEIDEDSLSKICYLILIYFLRFLKGIFLALSRMVEPSRALTSIPLAKYNITFLDAIGRPPRILPYEYFRSFKILQAFIEQEFRDLPGSLWVTRGRYLVLSLQNNRTLNEENWNRIVAPGAKIAMSMLLRKRLKYSSSLGREQCPESNCSGIWRRPENCSWIICPVCRKEVFNRGPKASDVTEDAFEIENQKPISSSDPGFWQKTEAPVVKEFQEIGSDHELESAEEDISSFRRIAREAPDLNAQLPWIFRSLKGSPYENIDLGYKIVPIEKRKEFGRVGRVFMMLWGEPTGPPILAGNEIRNGSHISRVSYGGKIYSEIRRFVVAEQNYGHSVCLAIHTYGGRATLKPILPDAQNHAIIFTNKNVPQEHSYQANDGTIVREILSKDPIQVRCGKKCREQNLHPLSRINYSKIYAVDNGIRVLNIGMVDKNSLPSFIRDSPLSHLPEGVLEAPSRRKKREKASEG